MQQGQIRATDPTGNPVATPKGPAGNTSSSSSSSSSSSRGSSKPSVTTGYIDAKGLWVPYGVD